MSTGPVEYLDMVFPDGQVSDEFAIWLEIRRLSAEETAAHATTADPRRSVRELLLLGASAASLGAVGFVLLAAHTARPPGSVLLAGLGVVSMAVSWCTVHVVFMLRYASLYYGDPAGGIDFGPQAPDDCHQPDGIPRQFRRVRLRWVRLTLSWGREADHDHAVELGHVVRARYRAPAVGHRPAAAGVRAPG
jgi:hypothetical protein